MCDAGALGAEGWEDVLARLNQHADFQRLVQRAIEGHAATWVNMDKEDLAYYPFAFEEIHVERPQHELVFKPGMLLYPYILTELDLFVGPHQVGEYTLVTLLNGEDDDTYFVIFEEYQTGGRAVSLIEEWRQERSGRARGSIPGADSG
jgi:hypothetical protein